VLVAGALGLKSDLRRTTTDSLEARYNLVAILAQLGVEAIFSFNLIPTEMNYRNEFSARNCLQQKVIRRFISHLLRHSFLVPGTGWVN
jgi:hypothetical protein